MSTDTLFAKASIRVERFVLSVPAVFVSSPHGTGSWLDTVTRLIPEVGQPDGGWVLYLCVFLSPFEGSTVSYSTLRDDDLPLFGFVSVPSIKFHSTEWRDLAPYEFVNVCRAILGKGWFLPHRARVLMEFVESHARYPTVNEALQLLAAHQLAGEVYPIY
jgi:hypothetical protein